MQNPATSAVETDVSRTVQVARVVCIILMMYAHLPLTYQSAIAYGTTWDQSSMGWLATLLHERLSRASVPLLSMLSGWLFAKTFRPGVWRNIARKGNSLLVPLLVWNLVTLVVLMGLAAMEDFRWNPWPGNSPGSWANALLAYKIPPINYPLYFLRDLFLSTVAGTILLQYAPRRVVLWTCALLALLLVIVADIKPVMLNEMILPQFLIGIAVQRSWDLTTHRTTLASFLLGCALTGLYWLGQPDTSPLAELMFRFGIAALLWSAASALARHTSGALLARLSPAIFVVFCSHEITFHLLRRLLKLWTGTDHGPMWSLAFFTGTLLATGAGWLLYLSLRAAMPAVLGILNGGRRREVGTRLPRSKEVISPAGRGAQ